MTIPRQDQKLFLSIYPVLLHLSEARGIEQNISPKSSTPRVGAAILDIYKVCGQTTIQRDHTVVQ